MNNPEMDWNMWLQDDSEPEDELDEANATILRLRQSGLLERLHPGHPNQIGRNGQLTELGVDCCWQLFEAGASPFVVAHLMRLSLRATTRQFQAWRPST